MAKRESPSFVKNWFDLVVFLGVIAAGIVAVMARTDTMLLGTWTGLIGVAIGVVNFWNKKVTNLLFSLLALALFSWILIGLPWINIKLIFTGVSITVAVAGVLILLKQLCMKSFELK